MASQVGKVTGSGYEAGQKVGGITADLTDQAAAAETFRRAQKRDALHSVPPARSTQRGPGLRVRFSRIKGVTARGLLVKPLYLPCTLNEFTVVEGAKFRDYDTIGAGEFSIAGPGGRNARPLREQTLETLTIDWHEYAKWLINPRARPGEVKRIFRNILRERTPIELLAVMPRPMDGVPEELRMKFTLRETTRTLKPGEADTRYYTLSIKEWRDNSSARRGEGRGTNNVSKGGFELPARMSLKADTTLESAAFDYYRDKTKWRFIAQANGIKDWGSRTALVKSKRFKAGDVIKIPELVQTGRITHRPPGSEFVEDTQIIVFGK